MVSCQWLVSEETDRRGGEGDAEVRPLERLRVETLRIEEKRPTSRSRGDKFLPAPQCEEGQDPDRAETSCIARLQNQDESERRLASEGQPYKSGLRGDGEDAEGAAGAVDDFEGGGDDHGAGGGQLIEIAKAGEAKLSASVHDVVV